MNAATLGRRLRYPTAFAAAVLLSGLSLPAWPATRPFSAQRPADAAGTVEVVNVSGSIEISGWEQAAVDVSGTIGDRVQRVDVTSNGNRTTVRVVLPEGNSWGGGNSDARLKIRVPRNSALEVSLVSADLRVSSVAGNQHLQTVSGAINGEDASGNLQVETVSGEVRLAAQGSHSVQVSSISGNLLVSGADGDAQIHSVSGAVNLTLGALNRLQLESISGDVKFSGTLAAGGQFNSESVSGNLLVNFAALPDADIDVQSFSGGISSCFGPKPARQEYGPGSRLSFRSGKGGGRVHIDTQSGDVRLCAQK